MSAHEQAAAILQVWQQNGKVDFGSLFSARWAVKMTGLVADNDLDAVARAMVELTGGLAPIS